MNNNTFNPLSTLSQEQIQEIMNKDLESKNLFGKRRIIPISLINWFKEEFKSENYSEYELVIQNKKKQVIAIYSVDEIEKFAQNGITVGVEDDFFKIIADKNSSILTFRIKRNKDLEEKLC